MSEQDLHYMRLALQEAEKGKGRTSPNPCVGAVIVKGDTIVGRGYHRRAGTPHAEVNAIADAGVDATGSTIYVTLEPCNHTGRTPPCTKAILDAGLSRVVVGMPDLNPGVAGGGNAFLRSQGLSVECGLLEAECRALNRPFIKHSSTGLPWVVMKAGMSMDGKISYSPGQGGKITGEQSQQVTHGLRNTLDAILIGVDTAIIDNPSLTTRLEDIENVRDPLRIVLDTNLRLPPDSRMLTQSSTGSTWIYCSPEAPEESKKRLVEAGAMVYPIDLTNEGRLDLQAVFAHLGKSDINSVLVEGGAAVHGSMLTQGLVDEVYLFLAPIFIGARGTPLLSGWSGLSADSCPGLVSVECDQLGKDILLHGLVQHS